MKVKKELENLFWLVWGLYVVILIKWTAELLGSIGVQ